MNHQLDRNINSGAMLNVYPDSMGERLLDIVSFLKSASVKGAFRSVYILPSLFNTDLDRGFSVIDYSLNKIFAAKEDLDEIHSLKIDLMLDFILNHASVLSPQFQDLIKKGGDSVYKDFFIDWNAFWQGYGNMTPEGYIQPDEVYLKDMFFRKPGLPILMVRMPDGRDVPYWNTFYQEVSYPRLDACDFMELLNEQYQTASNIALLVNESLNAGMKPAEIDFGTYGSYREKVIDLLENERKYMGQMDLNIMSPLVWQYYDETLKTLAEYGAGIVRLDAFAYASKIPGKPNFMNEPEIWELLNRVRVKADQYGITLLPEIHAPYNEKIHEKLAKEGYMTYDFFMPGLILDALESQNPEHLLRWALEMIEKNIYAVNMLGCHDGIPLLDLRGLLSDERINALTDIVIKRGGYVKNLHGQQQQYYQVNAAYYSALGESDHKMLLARAIQLFMPGKPMIYYLDLFAGKNDYEAMKKAGAGGHKDINRTNLSLAQVEAGLSADITQKQLEMIRFRNSFPAFGFDAKFFAEKISDHCFILKWQKKDHSAILEVDLNKMSFHIKEVKPCISSKAN